MAISPPLTSVGANKEVSDAFRDAGQFGEDSFSLAFDMIGQLRDFNPTPVSFDTSFTVPDGLLTGFDRPDRPPDPDLPDFFIKIPEAPPFDTIGIPDFGAPPTFDGSAPALDFSGRPRPFAKAPPSVPSLFAVNIPDKPDLPFPPLPSLEEIDLPKPPDIIEHAFLQDRPEFTERVPDGDLEYEFTPYSSALLDEVTSEVSRLLKGGTGLPPAIEQAIFDRTRDREDVAADQAIDEVMNEYAARGFSLPSGILDKRVKEVRQQNQQNRSSTNRELTVLVHETEIENLRFAIQQGIAAENLTTQLFLQSEDLKLRAASTVADIALNVFRAKVEVFNSQVQAFRVDAEVFRTLIEAELSKVEVFRAQIEAERVKGELNQQRVDLYVARLQALDVLVGIFNAEVGAAQTVAQTNESVIRGFAAEVDAYRSEVAAKESEFAAWGEQIRGELGKVQGFEAETRAFTARTQAFAAGADAQAITPRLQLEQQSVQADQFRAQIAGVQAQIAAEAENINSIATVFNSKASIFSSEAQMRAAEADTNTRQFQAKLEESRLTSEQSLAQAELDINQVVSLSNQVVQALQGAAQAASQLAASSFSSVNASASISESGSASNSWSQSLFKDVT